LLVFTGLLPWQFFAHGTADSGNSLLDHSRLITKIYFPRIFVPVSPVVSAFLDLLISLLLLAPMLWWHGQWTGWRLLLLPVFLLLAIVLTIGAGTWLTALHVKYRDVRYVIPFILQIGLYLAPVGYDTDIIPAHLRWIYGLNPMVGIIDGFRWCLLEGRSFHPDFLPGMVAVPLLVTGLGLRYFQATERYFADIL
jgi:lipopolysaccharide transport system permease protein